MLFSAFCVGHEENKQCWSCWHKNMELLSKDKEKLQKEPIVQADKPCFYIA